MVIGDWWWWIVLGGEILAEGVLRVEGVSGSGWGASYCRAGSTPSRDINS